MIAICIVFPILIVAGVMVLCFSSGEQQPEEYYVDGYHVYYDRKIIRKMNQENQIIHIEP